MKTKIHICDICGDNMEHCMFWAKYKLKIRKQNRCYDGWKKLDVCDRCMNKIIEYVNKGG